MLKIKELRENLKLTQEDLAKKLGYVRTCVSSWESNRTQPNIDDLKKLSAIFGCTVDYLIGNENEYGIVTAQSSALTLTKEESEMLATFKLLTLEEQYQAIGFVKALAY